MARRASALHGRASEDRGEPAIAQPKTWGKTSAPRVRLTGDDTALLVPIDDILPGKNARTDWDAADERLNQLAASIQEQGILEPLIVREVRRRASAGRRTFELIAGFRRYTAARILHLSRVPVRVIAASDDETMAVNLAENLSRAELADADAIAAVAQLRETYGWGVRRIARSTGRSPGWVSGLLAVAGNARVRQAVADGQLSMEAAMRMVRLRGALAPVREQLVARLDTGDRIPLSEVPRVHALERATRLDTLEEREPVGDGPCEQSEEADVVGRQRATLELTLQEQSLVRNMRLIVGQVLSALAAVRRRQPAGVLPSASREELERAAEEICEFLAREPGRRLQRLDG